MARPQLLTPAAVRYLRRRLAERKVPGKRKSGTPTKTLCSRYGITSTAIWQAATGRTYKQVRP